MIGYHAAIKIIFIKRFIIRKTYDRILMGKNEIQNNIEDVITTA